MLGKRMGYGCCCCCDFCNCCFVIDADFLQRCRVVIVFVIFDLLQLLRCWRLKISLGFDVVIVAFVVIVIVAKFKVEYTSRRRDGAGN